MSYSNQKWKYEEFSGKIELFKMMIGKVPNEIFSVDQPFNVGMDHFAEDLSNFDINGQSTTSRVAIPNPNYSVDGIDRDPMLQKVTLSDLLYPKSPLTQYFKEEYAKIKELGYDVSYEDYQELCFASTAFEYYSIGEENRDLAVNIIVNGAMLAVGASLPWKIAAAWGLVSGVKNGTEAAVGKDAITGKDLSPQERIARGLFGALDVGLAGYSGAKGFKNRVKTPKKASGANSIITPEMEEKILWGQRKNLTKNEIIGGHSSSINNNHPNFATETIKINPDVTKDIKIVTQFPDGNLSKIKNSTVFPNGWSDTKILDSIKDVGNSPIISVRGRDGATWHRAIVDGVEIDVIKLGDNIVSGYPTGKVNAPIPGGFTK